MPNQWAEEDGLYIAVQPMHQQQRASSSITRTKPDSDSDSDKPPSLVGDSSNDSLPTEGLIILGGWKRSLAMRNLKK